MNTFRVLLVAALVAIASCADMTYGPSQFSATDGNTQWQAFQITNTAGVQISSVSFTVSSPGVSISYPAGQSSSSVGTINNGATGSGQFNTLASTGNYPLSFTISYKKSGVTRSATTSITLVVQDGGPSTGKRDEIQVDLEALDAASELEIVERSDLSGRDFYVSINTNGVAAEDGAATWNYVTIATGTVAVNSVSYSVVDTAGVVSISYPYSGNSLGSMTNNATKNANFQTQSNCGYYNLNVTISYKLQGTSSVRRTWKIVLLGVTGPNCEGGDSLGKRAEMIRANGEDASATGFQSNRVPVEYAVAIGLAGVALVAVFSVVGTMFFMRRRSQETIVA